jgi:hemolysin III
MMRRFREPVNGLTHFAAAVLAFFGLIALLILGWGDLTRELSFLIYGLSLIGLFSASAIYHLVQAEPAVLERWRKLDHSAIYVLIAGTYTPICLHFFESWLAWGLPLIIWLMALAGLIVKLFIIKAPRWTTAGIYLLMGWLAILAVGEIIRLMPLGALIWLLAGGLFYTGGFHELWHIFVILGAFSHYMVMLLYIATP